MNNIKCLFHENLFRFITCRTFYRHSEQQMLVRPVCPRVTRLTATQLLKIKMISLHTVLHRQLDCLPSLLAPVYLHISLLTLPPSPARLPSLLPRTQMLIRNGQRLLGTPGQTLTDRATQTLPLQRPRVLLRTPVHILHGNCSDIISRIPVCRSQLWVASSIPARSHTPGSSLVYRRYNEAVLISYRELQPVHYQA